MDLKSVAAVIGRHRTAMAVGVVVALALAFLAAYRLDASSFPPPRRQATTYESTARLFGDPGRLPLGALGAPLHDEARSASCGRG